MEVGTLNCLGLIDALYSSLGIALFKLELTIMY